MDTLRTIFLLLLATLASSKPVNRQTNFFKKVAEKIPQSSESSDSNESNSSEEAVEPLTTLQPFIAETTTTAAAATTPIQPDDTFVTVPPITPEASGSPFVSTTTDFPLFTTPLQSVIHPGSSVTSTDQSAIVDATLPGEMFGTTTTITSSNGLHFASDATRLPPLLSRGDS